jgi:hypothetical protein
VRRAGGEKRLNVDDCHYAKQSTIQHDGTVVGMGWRMGGRFAYLWRRLHSIHHSQQYNVSEWDTVLVVISDLRRPVWSVVLSVHYLRFDAGTNQLDGTVHASRELREPVDDFFHRAYRQQRATRYDLRHMADVEAVRRHDNRKIRA